MVSDVPVLRDRPFADVWVPLGLQIVAFWFAAVPLSTLFSIHYGYGAPGLWYGILCGVTLSILFLGLRFRLVASRPIAAI